MGAFELLRPVRLIRAPVSSLQAANLAHRTGRNFVYKNAKSPFVKEDLGRMWFHILKVWIRVLADSSSHLKYGKIHGNYQSTENYSEKNHKHWFQ